MRKKIISIALTAAVSVAAVFMPVSAATYKGIDVYEGHSVIDWQQVATQTQFAWIKVSEAENYVDSAYKRNISGAEANGVKWGPYEFLRLYSPESCARQAYNFWGRIRGLNYSVIPAVDVESYDNSHTSAQVIACVRAFVDEFRSLAGYNPIIYSYTSYITNNALAANFTDCKLWQADYRGYAGTTGWAGGWSAWQYNSKGILAGINNHYVDLSQGTADIFMSGIPAASGGSQPAPSKSATVKKASAPPFPGAKYFGRGKSNAYIKQLDRALIKAGYGLYYKYGSAGASTRWGNGTQRACAVFQRAQGWRGSAADGIPGPKTWARLQKYM
jgi:GH25 family lysozyme M1 (1,4-beta-N-acetylmuramidase)